MPTTLNARTVEIINNISPGADQVNLGQLMDDALSGVLPPGSVTLAEIEKMTLGKVMTGNGTTANTAKTISASAPAFSGTGATISPTAAFTGSAATISPTAALSAAPTFTGSAMGTHQHDAITAGTPAGTITGKLELATPAFSGTGWTTAGQVVTTTDNQTMPATTTAAGMWLVFDSSPASPPVLIMSNTIVAGAPAVLTVQGVPAVTGVGTYKIFTMGGATFVGTAMATHQHAAISAGTPAGSNSAPAITVTGAAYTPAGSVAVTGASYTPAGSVAAPAITLA